MSFFNDGPHKWSTSVFCQRKSRSFFFPELPWQFCDAGLFSKCNKWGRVQPRRDWRLCISSSSWLINRFLTAVIWLKLPHVPWTTGNVSCEEECRNHSFLILPKYLTLSLSHLFKCVNSIDKFQTPISVTFRHVVPSRVLQRNSTSSFGYDFFARGRFFTRLLSSRIPNDWI